MFHFEIFEFVKSRGRPKLAKNPKTHFSKVGRPGITDPGIREFQMRDWYLEGRTLQEIADLQTPNLTRERVRQILKKYFGITRKNGGSFVKSTPKLIADAIEKKIRVKEKRDQSYQAIYGCDEESFVAINGSKKRKIKGSPSSAYAYQRNASIYSRGIPWNLSFPDWWKIWQDSGHWEDRGRGNGYCMTRIGDTGGYEVGNVAIKTNAQNFSDSWIKHPSKERNAKRKTNKKGTKTHCPHGHQRTLKNTGYIAGKKICKACQNERARKRYAENRKKLQLANQSELIKEV